jgi:hypothetical protein
MNGLFVHGGTDEEGYRFFGAYSSKVNCITFYGMRYVRDNACGELQDFLHYSNSVHTAPDSTAVAAMFDSILQPLLVRNVPRAKKSAGGGLSAELGRCQ